MRIFYAAVMLLLAFTFSWSVRADSSQDAVLDELGITVKEKKRVKAERKKFDENLKFARERCGFEIKYKIDYRSFKEYIEKSEKTMRGYRDALHYCGWMFTAIGHVCKDEDYRTAFKKKVDTIICQFDEKAEAKILKREGPTIALKKKILIIGYKWETSNLDWEVRKWLKANL